MAAVAAAAAAVVAAVAVPGGLQGVGVKLPVANCLRRLRNP
jgi:hypothetical protein